MCSFSPFDVNIYGYILFKFQVCLNIENDDNESQKYKNQLTNVINM